MKYLQPQPDVLREFEVLGAGRVLNSRQRDHQHQYCVQPIALLLERFHVALQELRYVLQLFHRVVDHL